MESMARVIEGVERLAAFDPALPAVLDAEAAVREIAEIYNAPMDLLRGPHAMAASRERQAEAAERQAVMAEDQAVAGVAKDLAQARR